MGIFGLVMAGRRTLPRVLPLFRNPRVPAALKVVTVALGLVIVSPLDPFADVPILGLISDGALLAILANLFVAIAVRWLERAPVPVRSAIVRVVPSAYDH